MGQTAIGPSATIAEHESLLIGAIDMGAISIDNPERSFFLKGNVQFPPDEAQRLTLETISGFSSKYFFFIKLRPRYETTKAGMYTLSVRISNRYRNVVTFPVSVRRCGVSPEGTPRCIDGLTNLGSIVVKAVGGDDERDRYDYDFERVKDEDVLNAFSRRFELEERPTVDDPDGGAKIFEVKRR